MSAAVKPVYLPSEKYIINHDIMNCTADGVVANHLYSGRALGLSQPDDIIQLHRDLQILWPDIVEHYKRIGLEHTENVIWNLDLGQLAAHIGYKPSVFYFGPKEYKSWGDHNWLEVVEYINSKNNFMALAEKLHMDVPKTLCFDSVTEINQKAMQDIVFPCYLKAAVSVSGVGIYRCEDAAEFVAAVGKFAADIPVQVQEEVPAETFLNLQYQVAAGKLVRLAASEQILEGFVHKGNRVPASHEPWETVDVMAHWLWEQGIKGIFAFDVAVVATADGYRYPAIECNPRYNGASYPTLLAKKLNISEWCAINVSTRHRTLADIDLAGIEYRPESGKGVIIVNWGPILEGAMLVLLAGTKSTQESLAVELAARLC